MKVLIFGSSGQIGSEVSTALLRRFGDADDEPVETLRFNSLNSDMTNFDAVKSLLYLHKPEVVCNAAGFTNVEAAESNKITAFSLNAEVLKHIALICEDLGAVLVHISTDYVFNGLASNPYVETDPTDPLSTYGSSKLQGEMFVTSLCKRHIVLRTSWVFGFTGLNFVKKIMDLSQEKPAIAVVADQIGGPTSARGVANCIAEIIYCMLDARESDVRWGIYHFSGYPYVSWARFAEQIVSVAYRKGKIRAIPEINYVISNDFPSVVNRPTNSRLNCNKVLEVFGVVPDDWKRSLGDFMDKLEYPAGQ